MLRDRSSLLETMELFRRVCGQRRFSSLILFLYACENEGLTFTELASLAEIHLSTSSRLIKALAGESSGAFPGLSAPLFTFETSLSDRRLKLIYLSDEGRALRDELERLISQARPISPPQPAAA
jgi:DNA-binding MarR family transcriptional regulator